MKSNASSQRFPARIRRRTIKAEEIYQDQLEYAKLDSHFVADGGRFLKGQNINKGDTLGATATSRNNIPKKLSKKRHKAQDMGDTEEAEDVAGIIRLGVSLVLQARVNSSSKISGGKNDTLTNLPGIGASGSRVLEEALMKADFAHASPRTPQSMNQRDFWTTDEISYLQMNNIVDQEANNQAPASDVEDGVGLNPPSAPYLAQPDLYELQEEFGPLRQRDISIYEDPLLPGVTPEEFAYRYEFEKLYEDSEDYFFL